MKRRAREREKRKGLCEIICQFISEGFSFWPVGLNHLYLRYRKFSGVNQKKKKKKEELNGVWDSEWCKQIWNDI